MSGGTACACEEKQKSIAVRNWVVVQRRCNYSAFSGYHFTPSAYSEIFCKSCSAIWRTKGAYVVQLPDGKIE